MYIPIALEHALSVVKGAAEGHAEVEKDIKAALGQTL